KSFSEFGFPKLSMAPEDRDAQPAKLLHSVANRAENDFCFTSAGITAGNTEHANGGNHVLRMRLRFRWNGQVGTDRDESALRSLAGKPGQFFRGNSEHREIGEDKRAAHGVDLGEAPNGIDEAATGIRLNVVKDHAHAGPGRLQDLQHEEYFLWETTLGPSQRSVLEQHPGVAPAGSLTLQCLKCVRPAKDLPWHAVDFQLDRPGLESCGEIAAIFLDRVGGFVFAAEKRDDRSNHLGRASTWFSSSAVQV